jgi:hypothetical protein
MADVQISGVMPHYIDPTIEHVGVSKLRQLNAANLGKLKKMLVIQDNDQALAVLVRYEQYLIMQNQLEEALRTIQMLKAPGVIEGLHDAAEGKVTPLSEVDPDLK